MDIKSIESHNLSTNFTAKSEKTKKHQNSNANENKTELMSKSYAQAVKNSAKINHSNVNFKGGRKEAPVEPNEETYAMIGELIKLKTQSGEPLLEKNAINAILKQETSEIREIINLLKNAQIKQPVSNVEYKKYKRCGYFLVGINAVWMITAVYIVLYNNAYSYPGTLIYAAALYAFYSIIAAIIKTIRWRRVKSPLMHAVNHLHLVTAMIAIFSLQTAMLSQFGSQDLAIMQLANSVTGGIVCVLVMIIGIYMIIHARKEIKMIRK